MLPNFRDIMFVIFSDGPHIAKSHFENGRVAVLVLVRVQVVKFEIANVVRQQLGNDPNLEIANIQCHSH